MLTLWLGDPSTCYLVSTAWLSSLAVRGLLRFCTRCLGVGGFLSVSCSLHPVDLGATGGSGLCFGICACVHRLGRLEAAGRRRVFPNSVLFPKCVLLSLLPPRGGEVCVCDTYSKGTRCHQVAWPMATSSQGRTAGAALKEGLTALHVGSAISCNSCRLS